MTHLVMIPTYNSRVCLLDAMQAARAAQFGPDAPPLRIGGRCVPNWPAQLATGWAGIGDSLLGFRVYPVDRLPPTMQQSRWIRRFDFHPEAAVQPSWDGVPAINLPAPVRYLRPEEGGVSHFRYGRDTPLLIAMHTRLVLGALARLPARTWRYAGCRRGKLA